MEQEAGVKRSGKCLPFLSPLVSRLLVRLHQRSRCALAEHQQEKQEEQEQEQHKSSVATTADEEPGLRNERSA